MTVSCARDPSSSCLPPPGLAQAFEHVGMVFRPMPRDALMNEHVEYGRRDLDSLLYHLLRLHGSTELTQRRGKPTRSQSCCPIDSIFQS